MNNKWPHRLLLSVFILSIVFLIPLKTFAQNTRTITGTVVEQSTQETLPGVSVKIKNSNIGAVTDVNGKFTITAKNNDVLVISYIGYEPQELAVGTRTALNIALKPNIAALDEVIVVGYGTVQKRDITGAITSVTSKQIQERSPINIFDAIQGQSAGVMINQDDGRPGAEASVVIRGIGTLGAGAGPLYIVDGAQGVNIDGINPADVERIEILKDASSAAIYGSRGANGVIIITTKRGLEGKPRIDANYMNSYSELAHRILKSDAYLRRVYAAQMSGGISGDDGGGASGLPADSLNPGSNADIDSYGILMRTAVRHDASVNMSGATKTLKYYAGLQYLSDEGIVHNSWAKIGRFRMNADYAPSDRFLFSSTLQFSLRNENMVNEANTISAAISRGPNTAIYWMDGSLAPNLGTGNNPMAWALLYVNERKTWDANVYNKVNYKITKDLQWTTDATLKFNLRDGFTFTPRRAAGNIALFPSPVNRGSESNNTQNNWQVQSFLNYNKKLGGDHTITALLGGMAERNFSKNFSIAASDYVSEQVLTLNSAQVFGIPNTSASRNSAISGFGRLGYNYKGKYQINGTMRADASSRFGIDKRWGYFPSISAAWNISEEPFMAWSKKIVDDVKIRGGYGVVGNDRLSDYDAIQRYVFGSQYYNGVSGVVINSRFGNNLLGWEVNKQTNVGVDVTLLKGRANFVADYYKKVTSDLLYTSPMAQEAGFTNVNVNTGSIQNKGFEFMISGYPIRTSNFQWNIGYNMSFNRGKVLSLLNSIPIQTGDGSLTEEGQPLGNFYGWNSTGIYPYKESNAYTPDFKERLLPVIVPGTTKFNYTVSGYTTMDGKAYTGPVSQMRTQGVLLVGGDVIWEDIDHNGVIDNNDRKILGNAQPDYFFGLSNMMDYKRFQLSFNFYGSMGGEIYNMVDATTSSLASTSATPVPYHILEAWRQPGDVTTEPKNKYNNPVLNTRRLNSRFIEDGSFIRLRNLKLGYNIPTNIASKIGASRIGMFVQVNNLATWSNYSWLDPEMSFSNPLLLGVETARIPRKNELIFGLNFNF